MVDLSVLSKAKILMMHGFKDFKTALKMYKSVFNADYACWKEFDWKAWLDANRFNSKTTCQGYADTSWKACKKRMTRHIWKLRTMKSTPDERPKEMDFKHEKTLYWHHLTCNLPIAMLNAEFKHNPLPRKTIEMSCPAEMAIYFDVNYTNNSIPSWLFAASIFAFYTIANAYDHTLGKSAFYMFIDALMMSHAFDYALKDRDLRSALRVLYRHCAKNCIKINTGTCNIEVKRLFTWHNIIELIETIDRICVAKGLSIEQ